MKLNAAKIGIILVQAIWIMTVAGFPSSIFDYCCEMGRQWYDHNDRSSCPPHPTADAQSKTQPACTLVIGVCCLAEHRAHLCLKGQQSALQGQSCLTVTDETRECCSCCQLGSMMSESGLPCDIPHHYGSECRASFARCCSNQTLNLAKAISVAMVTGDTTEARPGRGGLQFSDACDRNPCHQLCRPKQNSIECYCRHGYRLSADGRTCEDVNECADVELRHNCSSRERCVNTFGGFRCQTIGGRPTEDGGQVQAPSVNAAPDDRSALCPDGHQWNRRSRRCEDVDECASARHRCVPGTTCINTRGSYRCVFPSDLSPRAPDPPLPPSARPTMTPPATTAPRPIYIPWRTQSITIAGPTDSAYEARKRNTDPARAARTRQTDSAHLARTRPRSRPHHRQTTTPALQATRRCGAGYRINPVTAECEDVDECQIDGGGCPMANMVCRNTVGSFACTCSTGYQFNPRSKVCEDVDECRARRHDCMSYETCENTIGSFVCRSDSARGNCSVGYTTDPTTARCTDIDECSRPRRRCAAGLMCINTPGSYRCLTRSCDKGTRIDVTGNCVDIDECEANRGACRANEECKNTIGSFICRSTLSCGIGYEMNEQGTSCEDTDECHRGRHSCHGPLMTCVNRPGTYTCQCLDGYQMNHATHSCDDIDECHKFGGHVCAQNARCENTEGSFRCICQEGFELETDSKFCNDVNECEKRRGLCEHSCRNTWGSYYCTCNDGYQLSRDGRTCSDIDECGLWMETGRTTDVCLGICHNIPGSYLCTCPTGYQMSRDGRTCQDVDECVLGLGRCSDPDEVCLNTGGGFECRRVLCPSGFVKTPKLNSQMPPPRPLRAPIVWETDRHYPYGGFAVRGFPPGATPTTASSWRPVPTNVLRGVVAQPILFLSNEDSGVVCQKVDCPANDITCILNLTKSVQWQHVALPTMPLVSGPTDVINVQTIAYSVHPNNEFRIVAGNDPGLFDIIRQPGFTDRGVVRLLKPISGPAEHTLTLRMDNYNRQRILISQHIAHIVIVVSRYRF